MITCNQKGSYKLICGDCTKIIKSMPNNYVNMVLCDPPYGIDFQSSRCKKDKRKPKIKNDKSPFISFIPLLKRIIKKDSCVMIFTRWDVQQCFIDCMNSNGMKIKNVLIWDKVAHGMGDLKTAYGSRYESILFHSEHDFRFNGKRPTDIVRCSRVSPSRLVHPNEKPVDLLEQLIEQCTKQGDIVFDPFMGSCSTGIACVRTKRKFIGVELDKHYYNLSCERMKNEYSQEIEYGEW